ncbi:hypothetical protein A5886_002658 [Enterococcus sp. 8G7_MSG3316]|uniref:Uncharacterized protein n=1 Tax=Candidatus Enterococcus testudinis TaxID=1834191 RepID=A0A242A948_9ENTE|nr:hypothetical protein [Enterococcus sp. 8G7_MSG3316]OTN77558.1 hypothetical protein A5886_002658 [Enterococcus sp. 8G7_MSG3316]
MFNEYFAEEITIMPNFLKTKYIGAIRGLIKTPEFENKKSQVEAIFAKGNGSETSLKEIAATHNDLLIAAHKNIESNKSLKYSALYELDDERTSEEIIDLITNNNGFLECGNTLNTQVQNLKATKLNDVIKFTFFLDGIRIKNNVPIPIKTTYSVIVKFWGYGNDNKKFIEIDADNVASYFRLDKSNFFEQMIATVEEYLQSKFSLTLIPIDLFQTLENIKEKVKKGELADLPIASAQKMVLSSGSQAILDSNDAETIILPILGELRKLIEDNEELFSEASDVKILLEGFIQDTETMSDLPWMTFTWDNKIKSKKIQVKFVLSEYPYTLLNYYSHNKGRSGMNDVVESLLKEYCNNQDDGEEEN